MAFLFQMLCAIAAGTADRYRGDQRGLPSKTLEALVYGALVGYIALSYPAGYWFDAVNLKELAIFSVFFAGAMAPGYAGRWSAVLNHPDHKSITRLFGRGLLGAAILWYPCYRNGIYSPMYAMALSFPIAALFARDLNEQDLIPEQFIIRWGERKLVWNFAESLRGWFNGFFVLISKL